MAEAPTLTVRKNFKKVKINSVNQQITRKFCIYNTELESSLIAPVRAEHPDYTFALIRFDDPL